MYMYMYIRIYIHTYMYIYMYIYVYMYLCIQTYRSNLQLAYEEKRLLDLRSQAAERLSEATRVVIFAAVQ